MRTKDDVHYKVEESKSFQAEEPSSVTNGFQPKQAKQNNNNKPVKESKWPLKVRAMVVKNTVFFQVWSYFMQQSNQSAQPLYNHHL